MFSCIHVFDVDLICIIQLVNLLMYKYSYISINLNNIGTKYVLDS